MHTNSNKYSTSQIPRDSDPRVTNIWSKFGVDECENWWWNQQGKKICVVAHSHRLPKLAIGHNRIACWTHSCGQNSSPCQTNFFTMGLKLMNNSLIARFVRAGIAIIADLLNGILVSSSGLLHIGDCSVRCSGPLVNRRKKDRWSWQKKKCYNKRYQVHYIDVTESPKINKDNQ